MLSQCARARPPDCCNDTTGAYRTPLFAGLAVGDQLPATTAAPVQSFGLYIETPGDISTRKEGGRIERGDYYRAGVMNIDIAQYISDSYWHPFEKIEHLFCGARTPATNRVRCYAPMPNGNHWKLDFQMFILPDAAPSEESDRIRSMRRKIEQDFPSMQQLQTLAMTSTTR